MKCRIARNLAATLVAATIGTALYASGEVVLHTYEIVIGYEWRYSLSDSGAIVRAAPQTIDGFLEVPGRFGEYPVVGIADSAFAGRDDIKELRLPDGIADIGYNAFANCTNLTELTIPDTVQTIGNGAFAGCTSLKKLTIPFIGSERGNNGRDDYDHARFAYVFGRTQSEGEAVIQRVWSINSYNYYVPTNLVEVVVTDETVVGQYAFAYCDGLKKVAFEGGVTNVDLAAFMNCTQLENVSFPDGLGA